MHDPASPAAGFRLTRHHCWDAACWLTPFVVLWWLAPFLSGTTLGNDYTRFAFDPHLELQIAWQAGQWPLYLPGYAGGQTASVLSLGQLHHPLPHLASWMPGFWEGHALSWMTFWRLVTLGAAHWVWWRLLRRLGWRADVAFAVTLVAIYHLRMLDCFRYGAGLESYTGMLFLAAAVGWQGLAPARPGRALAVGAAAYWLATAGHPQLTFYGFGGAAAFALLWPFVLRTAAPELDVPARRVWLRAIVSAGFGVLAAMWFLLPYYTEFVRENVGRVDSSYAWTLGFMDTVPGALASFALPLHGDAHGAFGGATLVALPVALWLLPAARARWPWPVWCTAGGALLTLAYALGDATPVHRIMQGLVPWLAYMRVPGRALIVWPLLLLAAATLLHASPPILITRGAREWRVPALAAACVASAAIALLCAGAWLAFGGSPGPFAPVLFRNAPASFDWLLFAAGLAGVTLLAIRIALPERGRFAGGVAIAVMALQVTGACYWGTFVEPAERTPTYSQLQERRRASWQYSGRIGERAANRAVWRQAHEGLLDSRLAWATTHVTAVATIEEAFALGARDRQPGQAIITDPPAASVPAASSTSGPASEPAPAARCSVAVVRSSFNHLVIETEMPAAGWLVTNLPYTGRWRAFAGETALAVRAANGLTTAVHVPAGTSIVTLYYVSTAAVIGVVVSALAIVLGGALLLIPVEPARLRLSLAAALTLFGLAAPTWWYLGLYSADLGYRYRWTTPPPPPRRNIAFGKSLAVEPPITEPGTGLAVASRAVDGDPAGVGLRVGSQSTVAVLTLDLRAPHLIAEVRLHRLSAPCAIQFSADATAWSPPMLVRPVPDSPTSVRPTLAAQARYVRLTGAGPGRLSLTEFEVFSK